MNLIDANVVQAMVDLQKSIDRQNNIIARIWVAQEHRCPLCKKALTDIDNINFTEAVGMCISCDHILSDGWTSESPERALNELS